MNEGAWNGRSRGHCRPVVVSLPVHNRRVATATLAPLLNRLRMFGGVSCTNNIAASASLTAVKVTGGTSATPTLMKANDDPQIAARVSSNP